MVDESSLTSKFSKAEQSHVLRFLPDLSSTERDSLLQQLDGIKVDELERLLSAALAEQKGMESTAEIKPFSRGVARSTDLGVTNSSYKVGIEAIGRGEVAALVMAGGQGTRLGFAGPKGMYNIGLPSGRTLFQLMCERILKLRKLAAKDEGGMSSLPFYIMTSPINHDETVQYFESQGFFGLPKDDVKFFQQGMLPCLTNEGKIIMESPSKVAMAPDGNGGVYSSLENTGMLKDMEDRGVQYLHVFSIDNALTKPADPVFMGYCISQDADCGNKVVWKSNAHEKVGVLAEKSGKPCIVEYSDITTEMAERTDEDGRLCFGAANICNHFYTLKFLKETVLPNLGDMFHVAKKKIPFCDEETRQTVTPEQNNGIKLESFIFDVFPLSQRMAVLDVLREDEFAPVKNAPGSPSDSPDTAREYLSKLAQKWVSAAGGNLKGDTGSICEIAPLTSYGGEGLSVKGKEVSCPFVM